MSRDNRTRLDTDINSVSAIIQNKTINFSKPASLAAAIAALSGLISAAPAQAGYNVPTDMTPSPLCINGQCATEFSDPLLLFEEFGLQKMPDPTAALPTSSLPLPVDCDNNPDGAALDTFLSEGLHSYPTRRADMKDDGTVISAPNPWEAKVKECLPATTIAKTTADGRPTGEWFAHQRWDEFFTAKQQTNDLVYFQSAMAGSRVNGGLRDKYQLHNYSVGEFAKGGLYYLDADGDGFPGSKGASIKIHSKLPAQNPQSVWTFDGTLPPKLLMARYGESILFRHYDVLPISNANAGFGKNTISTHEHNGHNPAESDGFAHSYFYSGQFYDYHWPMVLAGYDSINTDASDFRTGAPDGNGGIKRVRGDWRETMSTHWFHDHMLDFTAQNVYKGNAAMMNYYSAIDRGREPAATENPASVTGKPGYSCNYANANSPNLCFPSGSGLDWGNRDYDMNLVVADKAWDNSGQLKFNIFNTDGFLGDRITVNWIYKPYVDVRARKYRFRVLNGSVSRYYKIAVVKEVDDAATGKMKSYSVMDSYMIANDGNIMQHAVKFPNAVSAQQAWPTQAIAERYDMIIDFKGLDKPAKGTVNKIYLVNLLEHNTGIGAGKVIPLADVMTKKYVADGKSGDPVVGKFMEFRVKSYTDGKDHTDKSMNPADYVEGKKQMIPLNKPSTAELQAAVQRTFEFGKSGSGSDNAPWTIKTDGGEGLTADEHRVSAAPEIGKVEIWHIKSSSGGWSHPVHVHFEEGQFLYRDGKTPPPWEKYARKDVYRVGPEADSSSSIDIAIRIREFGGTYVEHCHNTQHEDHAMLLRWDSQSADTSESITNLRNSNGLVAIPTPMPDWEGADYYEPSTVLATYKTGDNFAKQSFVLPDGTSTGSGSTGATAPTANADTATVVVNQSTVINVLANDSANGSALIPSSVAVSNVTLGTTSVDATTGGVTYTAGATAGTGGFDYSVANANGTSSVVHVTVTISAAPVAGAAPTANADGPFNTTVGGSTAIDVLANDVANGSALIPSSVVVSNVTLGTTSVDAATGRVTFTATASGTGGFDYRVANADATSATAHVTVVVAATPAPVNDSISISRAQCKSNSWRITGTATVKTNNSVTFFRTSTVPTSPTAANIIGSTTVASDGSFDFRTTATCTSPISMQSAMGAVRNNQAVANK
jgi:FtsP/CotA-like multicopper oxidase with cupredoxin domain